jgi:hypothetical protein
MKAVKLSLVIMAAALLTIGLSSMAYAFHDGGVANCEGCHTMHNSIGNTAVLSKGGATIFKGVAYLLKGSDQSSTCINCHSGATLSSYHIFTTGSIAGVGPANYTPGGDFAWLTKSWTPLAHGATLNGQRLGHNVIAADFGLVQDPDLNVAPGGTYANTNLTCISCHDPHPSARIIDNAGTIAKRTMGQAVLPISGSGSYGSLPTATEAVGVYRILGGSGYVPKSYSGGPAFTTDPPVAVAPSTYNRKETATETRVAYGKGMSEWCANCHTSIHNDSLSSAFIHPASNQALLTSSNIAANYNAYKKSGDLSGAQATSYTSMVPFEEGTTTIATLTTHAGAGTGSTAGPGTGTENVMCLSCHRAHATGFRFISRWDNDSEFITAAGAYNVGTAAGNRNNVEYTAAMYDRPASNYATYQRSLCNKCHAKD